MSASLWPRSASTLSSIEVTTLLLLVWLLYREQVAASTHESCRIFPSRFHPPHRTTQVINVQSSVKKKKFSHSIFLAERFPKSAKLSDAHFCKLIAVEFEVPCSEVVGIFAAIRRYFLHPAPLTMPA